MTRLEEARIRQAKRRATQEQLEAALDGIIPNLNLPPSKAFEALLDYAVGGLVAQRTIKRKDCAVWLVLAALRKHGITG